MFRLRYDRRTLTLPLGRVIVGRGRDCNVVFDHPTLAAHHAELQVEPNLMHVINVDGALVFLNGTRVRDATVVKDGDTLRLGGLEVVVEHDQDSMELYSSGAVTQRQSAIPGADRGDGDPLLALSSTALAMGKPTEAGLFLQRYLARELDRYKAAQAETFPLACERALQMATMTFQSRWVEWIISAHHALGRLMSSKTIDVLYDVARKIKPVPLTQLRAYIEALRPQSEALGASEKFALRRLDGLVKLYSNAG